MPVMRSDEFGYRLHPIDLATNKVLARGRKFNISPRDLITLIEQIEGDEHDADS